MFQTSITSTVLSVVLSYFLVIQNYYKVEASSKFSIIAEWSVVSYKKGIDHRRQISSVINHPTGSNCTHLIYHYVLTTHFVYFVEYVSFGLTWQGMCFSRGHRQRGGDLPTGIMAMQPNWRIRSHKAKAVLYVVWGLGQRQERPSLKLSLVPISRPDYNDTTIVPNDVSYKASRLWLVEVQLWAVARICGLRGTG